MKNTKKTPQAASEAKGWLMLLLAILEGWMLCFATTHSRLAAPVGTGTPQWLITGSLVMAVVIPFVFMLVLAGIPDRDE